MLMCSKKVNCNVVKTLDAGVLGLCQQFNQSFVDEQFNEPLTCDEASI
jgi:hypothetical protein